MTDVQGNCPMGCGEGLILGEGGVIWCAALLCPRPTAAAEILADRESEHIVIFDADFRPRPDFLAETLPYMDDLSIGIVQTPQYFRVEQSQTWVE